MAALEELPLLLEVTADEPTAAAAELLEALVLLLGTAVLVLRAGVTLRLTVAELVLRLGVAALLFVVELVLRLTVEELLRLWLPEE